MKTGFIGAGNMAEAIIKGIISSGVCKSEDIIVTDISAQRLIYMKDTYQIGVCQDNIGLVKSADVVVLAVKPQSADTVFKTLGADYPADVPLISIAAGITTSRITHALGDIAVIRVMPNTPALVGAGAAGIYANKKGRAHLSTAKAFFEAIGLAVVVDNEDDMDTVTALSGSGPAYFFFMMEEMVKAGMELGLDGDTAKRLTLQTALGAAKLAVYADKDGESLEQLRRKVTSPGGTTEAAIKIFNDDQLGAIVVLAMEKAKERSKELSGR